MNYVYIQTESQLWTVGFYKPDGQFEPESDHSSTEDAATRVHYLNGGGADDCDQSIAKKTETNPPTSIELYGKRLEAIGRGKYPYECRAKDKWPNAMIYYSPDAGWDHEHSPCFLRRDKSKDR